MKKIFLHFFCSVFLAFILAPSVWAESTFVVRQIDVVGLNRIAPDTIYSYLPIKRGSTLTPKNAADSLKALYNTGFFENVRLARRGDVLVVYVTERPTIGQLKISGNSVIPTDKLTTVMRSLNIAEGQVYNPAVLEKIKIGLLNQYNQLGRYNARVDVNATPMSRNRMLVKINISEGLVTKVVKINIIGNHAFTEKELLKNMSSVITTPGLLTFYTQTDRYSEEKLDEALNNLRDFYQNHGYIKIKVKSAHSEITPDRKHVYITISIDEGKQYKVKSYKVTGDFSTPRTEIESRVRVRPGQVFSKQEVLESEKSITEYQGQQGYIYSTVNVEPEIDDAAEQVALKFNVNQGRHIYVHQISFSDNKTTNEEVLRREMEQLESAPISTVRLDSSKRRLQMLPYIKEVQMGLTPVPGTEDQVDINYKVKEDNAAQATFSVGYSQIQHIILSAGLVQKNFMGTGNTLGVNASRSKVEQYFGINFMDPFYTPDGISRSINLSVSKFDPGETSNVVGSYFTNEYDASVLYGIPIGQERDVSNRLQLGFGYQNVLVTLASAQNVSQQVAAFVNRNGRHFQELDLKGGFSRDSRDKALFPTRGMMQTLFADVFLPLDANSLSFYTFNYQNRWYQPIVGQFIATGRTGLGYGNGFHGVQTFPFFRNYFAGGIDTVRGYEGYTLGPQDNLGRATGGNMLADASIGIIFPNFISENLRTTAYFDIGNVYNSFDNRVYGGTASGPLRYSAGLEADMLTPLGSIGLSLGYPLNQKPGDQREPFQLALGASLG